MEYNVICAHISGPNFPYQISLCNELNIAREILFEKTGEKNTINLGLGSSGGNLTLHLLNASRGNSSKLRYFSSLLNSKLFARKWIPYFLEIIPSILGYILFGTFYKEGIGGYELFQKIYKNTNPEEDFELWTGTYDVELKRAQFFCNKNRNCSHINQSFFDYEQELYASKSLIYCNDDKKMIYDSAVASLSIPFMVPNAKINGVDYGDGGIMYASPLSVFYGEIYRIVSCEYKDHPEIDDIIEDEFNKKIIFSDQILEEKKNLRLYYIMRAHSLENKKDSRREVNIFNSAINASSIQDRNSAITLLKMLSPEGIKSEKFLNINSSILSKIIELFSERKHFVLCLFPHKTSSLCLSNFDGSDVLRMIDECSQNYGCQIWYSISYK